MAEPDPAKVMLATGAPAPGLPGVAVAAPAWAAAGAAASPPAVKAAVIEVSQTSSGTIAEMSRMTVENRISWAYTLERSWSAAAIWASRSARGWSWARWARSPVATARSWSAWSLASDSLPFSTTYHRPSRATRTRKPAPTALRWRRTSRCSTSSRGSRSIRGGSWRCAHRVPQVI